MSYSGGVVMQVRHAVFFSLLFALLGVFLMLLTPTMVIGQAAYTSQLTGVVTDASGGVIPGARVTLTDQATGVSQTYSTDSRGIYVFTAIRPATYTIKVEAPNLGPQERRGVVIAVSQQATLDFTL